MTADSKRSSADEPAPETPGKPKDSGSRQQRTHDQATQSGAPELDRHKKDKGVGGPIPPGPK